MVRIKQAVQQRAPSEEISFPKIPSVPPNSTQTQSSEESIEDGEKILQPPKDDIQQVTEKRVAVIVGKLERFKRSMATAFSDLEEELEGLLESIGTPAQKPPKRRVVEQRGKKLNKPRLN